jgi:C-terminal processing protease CtpA/Prc
MFIPAHVDYILARERKYDTTSGTFATFDYHPWRTSQDESPFLKGKKIIVLMDTNTASAAEILAAALKDCNGAILAGEHSYGKAIGQIRLHRRGRLGLQITFLQLKRINQEPYQNSGIAPDSTITVSPALTEDLRKREYLVKAVKIMEPEIDLMSISIPSALLKLTLQKGVAEGYRDVYEE